MIWRPYFQLMLMILNFWEIKIEEIHLLALSKLQVRLHLNSREYLALSITTGDRGGVDSGLLRAYLLIFYLVTSVGVPTWLSSSLSLALKNYSFNLPFIPPKFLFLHLDSVGLCPVRKFVCTVSDSSPFFPLRAFCCEVLILLLRPRAPKSLSPPGSLSSRSLLLPLMPVLPNSYGWLGCTLGHHTVPPHLARTQLSRHLRENPTQSYFRING